MTIKSKMIIYQQFIFIAESDGNCNVNWEFSCWQSPTENLALDSFKIYKSSLLNLVF